MEVEVKVANLQAICRSCAGVPYGDEVPCDSIDCPVYYSRVRESTKLRSYQSSALFLIEELENAPTPPSSRRSTPAHIDIEYESDSAYTDSMY